MSSWRFHPYFDAVDIPISYTANAPSDIPNVDSFPVTAILDNKNLWDEFNALGTEMIITKGGRRMFPTIQIQVHGLSPDRNYCVFLEMQLASTSRLKYSDTRGWYGAGSAESQNPKIIYQHPDSYKSGKDWMSQPISFGKLKITNVTVPSKEQIVLSSMHRYQPKIIIVEMCNHKRMSWGRSATLLFPETQFVAVTAYQNKAVTDKKVDNNPFAKGFRKNGKAMYKRNRFNAENNVKIDVETVQSNDTIPLLSPSSSGTTNSLDRSPSPFVVNHVPPNQKVCSNLNSPVLFRPTFFAAHHNQSVYPWYLDNRSYYQSMWNIDITKPYVRYSGDIREEYRQHRNSSNLYMQRLQQRPDEIAFEKKFSNFSIDSILNWK